MLPEPLLVHLYFLSRQQKCPKLRKLCTAMELFSYAFLDNQSLRISERDFGSWPMLTNHQSRLHNDMIESENIRKQH